MRWIVLGCIAWASMSAATVAGDEGWTTIVDTKKAFRVSVPSSWKVQERKQEDGVLYFDVEIPGWRQIAELTVRAPVNSPMPMRQLVLSVPAYRRDGFEVSARVGPLHILDAVNASVAHTRIWTRVNGQTIETTFRCARDERKLAEADLIELARKMTLIAPPFPVIPTNYKVTKAGRYRIAVHPSAGGSVPRLVRSIKQNEKLFTKFHGKLPSAKIASVIYVHERHRLASELYPAASKSPAFAASDGSALRLFSKPFPAQGKVPNAIFAAGFATFCFEQRYGVSDPDWAARGESALANLRVMGGLKLPELPVMYSDWANMQTIPRLDEMTVKALMSDPSLFRRQSFFYVLFFHCGPSKYKKAYKQFLAALSRYPEPSEARKKYLDPLGLDKLRDAVLEFKDRKVKYR